jgi:hypothetical protein
LLIDYSSNLSDGRTYKTIKYLVPDDEVPVLTEDEVVDVAVLEDFKVVDVATLEDFEVVTVTLVETVTLVVAVPAAVPGTHWSHDQSMLVVAIFV